jgi:hypothetical protein
MLPHRKLSFLQFLYYCLFTPCRGNVFTQPLPLNGPCNHVTMYYTFFAVYLTTLLVSIMVR